MAINMKGARNLGMVNSNAKSKTRMSLSLLGSRNWTPFCESTALRQGRFLIASLAILNFAVSCASQPVAHSSDEIFEDQVVEDQVVEEQGAEEAEPASDTHEEQGSEDKGFRPERLPYWGIVQLRADEAHEELADEIDRCLSRLGSDQTVRSITVKARRDLSDGPAYEITYLTSSPSAPEDEPCVEEISNRFIDTLGPGYFDDFDVYMATFIHRGAAGGECNGEGGHDNVYCVDFGSLPNVEGEISEATEACPDEFVEATQRAVSEARICRDVGGFHDRIPDYEDRGHELRAVLFADVRVEAGQARVVFRFNRPWVESFATCMSEHLDEIDVSEFDLERPCRSKLRNRSIVLWHRPWFVYLFE